MIHVLLDSSVLLAFSGSIKGASAFILKCCEQGKLKGYVSKQVLFECKKNAAEDMGEELEKANKAFDNPKDAPIITSAKQIKSIAFILSLDNGFFKPEVQKFVKPVKILKPGEFVNRFREELG